MSDNLPPMAFKGRCTVAVESLPNAPYRTMLANLLDEMLAAIERQSVPAGYVRFCPECGAIGEVRPTARDCCPDGSHAAYMPEKTAEVCSKIFNDLLEAAPQPQSVQPQGPMAETVEEAARDVAKCLNERDGQGLDLRHVAMLVNHAQQTVQQELVAWAYTTNGLHTNFTEIEPPDDAYDEGSLMALYTSPQAAQPLSDEQKQNIHHETGAGHALISLVESYITKGTT